MTLTFVNMIKIHTHYISSYRKFSQLSRRIKRNVLSFIFFWLRDKLLQHGSKYVCFH